MDLIFKGNAGEITLNGNGNGIMNILQIEGTDLIPKSRTLGEYADEDGMFEETSKYSSRLITVSGDIACENGNKEYLKYAIKCFSQKGTLKIVDGDSVKVIEVNASSLTLGQRFGKYIAYVIQFECDNPFFHDERDTVIKLFSKKDFLNKDTVLPSIFTSRVSKGTINNKGEAKVNPIIEIIKTDDDGDTNTILVKNNTTGKNIQFSRTMELDETVTIDIRNRTVKSSLDGNIIDTLSFYTSLADMWFDCGENIIEATVGGRQNGISIYITYNNMYLEAI